MAYGGVQERPGIRPERTSRTRQEGGGATAHDALERWLGRSLHGTFDAVIAEPVPGELLRLIEEAPRGKRGS